jgi:hypothetical protein
MDAFDQWVGIWVPLIIICVGALGNLTCLFVLSYDKAHNSLLLVLKALVASDLCLLVSGGLQQIVPMLAEFSGCLSHVCLHWTGYLRIYAWPVLCVTQMTSAWLTLLISTERYVAICSRAPCSEFFKRLPNVRLLIGFLVSASIVFNLPKFFEYESYLQVQPLNRSVNISLIVPVDSAHRRHAVYRLLYNMALTGVLVFALPIVSLLWLNTRTMLRIRHMLRFTEMNRQMRRKLKATRVPIGIFVVFCVCNTLALVSFVLDALSEHPPWLQAFMGVANMFVLLNAAVNFVLFYLLGSKFQLLCKRALGMCLQEPEALRAHQESPLLRRRFRPLLARSKRLQSKDEPLNLCVSVDGKHSITYSADYLQANRMVADAL